MFFSLSSRLGFRAFLTENLNLGAEAIKDIAKKNHLPCVCFVNWLVGECKKYVCNLGVG